ncbi:MAG: thioredoxin family protein [Pseudomonadota bacterium]
MQTVLIAILVIFSLAVAGLQLWTFWRAKQAQGQPAPDTRSVDGTAADDARRVYYFFGVHCGPCRAMTPVVDQLRSSHRNLIKIDVAETLPLARAFGIAATPSFVLVENGKITQVKIGAMSEKKLVALLEGAYSLV